MFKSFVKYSFIIMVFFSYLNLQSTGNTMQNPNDLSSQSFTLTNEELEILTKLLNEEKNKKTLTGNLKRFLLPSPNSITDAVLMIAVFKLGSLWIEKNIKNEFVKNGEDFQKNLYNTLSNLSEEKKKLYTQNSVQQKEVVN